MFRKKIKEEREELKILRKKRIENIEHDLELLKKCIGTCTNAIHFNQQSLNMLNSKVAGIKTEEIKKEEEKGVGGNIYG